MSQIKVMVVDDHIVVRTGLQALLNKQADIEVVADAENGSEALDKAQKKKPDVVIMDITMPVMDGIEATKKLKKALPDCYILALTIHEDKRYLLKMLEAGANGYISKQAGSKTLVTAIRTVASGNIFLEPIQLQWLLEGYHKLTSLVGPEISVGSRKDKTGLDILSKREVQVLELVAKGLTAGQIGEQLGISPKTVYRHRDRIKNKLNMRSSSDVLKFAIRHGLTSIQ